MHAIKALETEKEISRNDKHVAVTKSLLFGCEGDLELTRYAIAEGTVKDVLDCGEGQHVTLCSHRDTAL
jgi:hypothetical protein